MEKDVTVKYSRLGKIDDLSIIAYTDSSYRNAEDRTKSVGGKFIGLCNKEGKCGPLIWKSKTIQQVCKSVKTAETRSLEKGLEDAIYLARMLKEIYTGKMGDQHIPVEAKTDSKTLYDTLKSTKQVEEKSICHLVAWIKQQIEENVIQKVTWVPNKEMVADVFTKAGIRTDLILSIISGGKLHYVVLAKKEWYSAGGRNASHDYT